MNIKSILLVTAFAIICVARQAAFAGDDKAAQFNFNFMGGQKQLSDDWKATDTQDEWGVNIDVKGNGWPISLDLGYLYATKEGTASQTLDIGNISTSYDALKRTAFTEEASAGIKKIWMMGNPGFSFYIAGGASWIKGSVDFAGVSKFDDSKTGWYGSTGLYYSILKLINVGVYARYSDAKVTIANQDLNAGGWHYGVLAGLHF